MGSQRLRGGGVRIDLLTSALINWFVVLYRVYGDANRWTTCGCGDTSACAPDGREGGAGGDAPDCRRGHVRGQRARCDQVGGRGQDRWLAAPGRPVGTGRLSAGQVTEFNHIPAHTRNSGVTCVTSEARPTGASPSLGVPIRPGTVNQRQCGVRPTVM